MRGKSIDVEFIAEFVAECCANDKVTPKDFASEAKLRISNIEQEIRRIESLKLERSKLLDVVNQFDAPEQDDSNDQVFEEVEELQDELSSQILDFVGTSGAVSIQAIVKQFGEPLKQQIFLSVKKLAQAGVLGRNDTGSFVLGPKAPRREYSNAS